MCADPAATSTVSVATRCARIAEPKRAAPPSLATRNLMLKFKLNAVHLSGEPYDMLWGSVSDGVHIVVSVLNRTALSLNFRSEMKRGPPTPQPRASNLKRSSNARLETTGHRDGHGPSLGFFDLKPECERALDELLVLRVTAAVAPSFAATHVGEGLPRTSF